MKKIFFLVPVLPLAFFFTMPAFAKTKCGYYAPSPAWKGGYRCFEYPDEPAARKSPPAEKTTDQKESVSGCTQLDLTISCAASGSAVDWINTCSLDCGDENRYDALAVQQNETTLKCWHREVPPNRSCSVSVSSGLDSKEVGMVRTSGSCKQFLRGTCAW